MIAPVQALNTKSVPIQPKEIIPQYNVSFNEKLFKFISEGEGSFQAKAFCDSYYKTTSGLIRHPAHLCTRWSIGFGTISKQGEVITLSQARERRNADALRRMELIKSTCFTDNQMIATIDFMYQMGSYRSQVKNNANKCNANAVYQTFISWRDAHRAGKKSGLVKREQRRINLFYK